LRAGPILLRLRTAWLVVVSLVHLLSPWPSPRRGLPWTPHGEPAS
jgi:hypothetical protein